MAAKWMDSDDDAGSIEQKEEEDEKQDECDGNLMGNLLQTSLDATKNVLRKKVQILCNPKTPDLQQATENLLSMVCESPKKDYCDFCKGVRVGQSVGSVLYYGLRVNGHYDCVPCYICFRAIAGKGLKKTAFGQAHWKCVKSCISDMLQDDDYCQESNCWQHMPCLVHQEDSVCCLQ
jgi:hypothetical protein